jgi:hypothetical protein
VADEYGAVLIGETNPDSVSELESYYGKGGKPGLQLPMDYLFTNVNTLSATEYRKQIDAIDRTGHWPVYLISNHDIRRPVSRYGDGQRRGIYGQTQRWRIFSPARWHGRF